MDPFNMQAREGYDLWPFDEMHNLVIEKGLITNGLVEIKFTEKLAQGKMKMFAYLTCVII